MQVTELLHASSAWAAGRKGKSSSLAQVRKKMNTEGAALWDLPESQDALFRSLKGTSLVLVHGCCPDFTSMVVVCEEQSQMSCPRQVILGECTEQVSGQRKQRLCLEDLLPWWRRDARRPLGAELAMRSKCRAGS